MKIVTIVGARPQFIKAAVVSRAIAKHNHTAQANSYINEIIVHTGQHFDENMSNIFFDEMQIPTPNYQLEINSMSHGAMTGRMLEKIEEVLLNEKPDYVLVYGDTNSTLAGAIAAKKLHIKVVHVEAGLRSFNMRMPEEVNRILTDRISDILCCPTETAVKNLQIEGFTNSELSSHDRLATPAPLIVNTGDVMLDAALYYSAISAEKSNILNKLGLASQKFCLCTIHRAENTDDPERLTCIFAALSEISNEMKVVLPLHPRTRKILETNNSMSTDSLILIDPVGYFDMIEMLKCTSLVLTDSGGLQKEAYFFGKPCVTLRDETEWVELVETGNNVIAGANTNKILEAYFTRKSFKADSLFSLYGKGVASEQIINTLLVDFAH